MSKKQRPSEWEQLLTDYSRDNNYIRAQKHKWLEPEEIPVGKLPNNKDLQELDTDTAEIPKDKTKKAKSVMKAITNFVQNKKKSKSKSKAPKLDSDGDLD